MIRNVCRSVVYRFTQGVNESKYVIRVMKTGDEGESFYEYHTPVAHFCEGFCGSYRKKQVNGERSTRRITAVRFIC